MLATTLTAAILGIEARLICIEADVAGGFPRFVMVGLPDSAVKESEARIRAALRNCGYGFKWDRRITVNLAPASLRKFGSSFDLATAVGLLVADGAVARERFSRALLVGELALDGAVRPVSGVLPMLLLARQQGLASVIVPRANHSEAALVPDLAIHPVATLPEAVELLSSEVPPTAPPRPPAHPAAQTRPAADLADIRGQSLARRALEIAAAGGHNLLLVGPPGTGKTMLARRLPGILPSLAPDELLEVAAIQSAAGRPLMEMRRPFRSPHHTASYAALAGGGQVPHPGEVSLAHRGVLFLDELPEFPRRALEVLREPLEEGRITISRSRGTLSLPARFQLVAAMNPCPCGLRGSVQHGCRCTPREARAYLGRISGPLLDRIDLHVEMAPLPFADLEAPKAEGSPKVASRVAAARLRQSARQEETGVASNAELSPAALRKVAQPPGQALVLLRHAVDRLGLTGRGLDRLLRLARTLADMEGRADLTTGDVAEALHFRPGQPGSEGPRSA